ncbi:MAG: amidohydrolase [Lachnospiraceae bacterium]|nr:amidohydrolase [Lachnospiraceae bacterium]
MDVLSLAKKYQEQNIRLRREFHRFPEVSSQEFGTADRVERELNAMGIKTSRCVKNGVVGILKGEEGGKTLALRADIDALAVQEETKLPFASEHKGVMHACGHDGHTSSLLTAARILKETKDWKGTIKLLFQPNEEKAPSGAQAFIDAGVMEDVDGVMGLHLWNDLELGKISVEAGVRMATSARIKVHFIGKGGHGGIPHSGIDAILAASAFVMNLQGMITREFDAADPVILSIGLFHAGTEFNVLAQDAWLEGTVKLFHAGLLPILEEKIRRVAEATAMTYQARAKLEFIPGSGKPVVNHPYMSGIAEKTVEKVFGKEVLTRFEKVTPSDDFSRLSSMVPGLYAFVGTRNTDKKQYYPHHHPKFDIDEDALFYAAALYAQFALDYLNH